MPSLMILSPLIEFHWALLPRAVARIRKMADEFGCTGYGEQIVLRLRSSFVVDDPGIRAWVAVSDEGAEVVGHCIATVEKDGMGDFVLVWQAQTDFPMFRATRAAFDNLEAWAGERKAGRIIVAARGGRAAGMARRYGFGESYVVLTKVLK